ncbi:hypothetical protein RRG08_023311 [Elysia crispata]|uniref:Uncharacterized protein n=1 Tax=Elysia crispata TaxID=231223 RepID=A0AAE1EFE8_9GAST|nr:hypothetical protein RRG08_023311 [Elysia crispata]
MHISALASTSAAVRRRSAAQLSKLAQPSRADRVTHGHTALDGSIASSVSLMRFLNRLIACRQPDTLRRARNVLKD